MKQYMKQKQIQWGFKHWCRNDSKTGYPYKFDIRVGKKTASPEVGLSESFNGRCSIPQRCILWNIFWQTAIFPNWFTADGTTICADANKSFPSSACF